MSRPDDQPRPTVLRPGSGRAGLSFNDLWASRELVYFFAWRNIKVRYKQAVFGASWAIIQPFATMVVLSIVFGGLARVPSDGLPYPVFAFTALVPWTFFSQGVTDGAESLVANQNLLKKAYFPRMVIPIATVLSGLVDFSFAFLVLLALILFFGFAPTLAVVWILPLLGLATLAALGFALWLAALNVRYRDVRYVVPFLMQISLFATPIAYPGSLIAEPWAILYGLNPMVGVVEGFRWALLGVDASPAPTVVVGTIVTVLVLAAGAFYFRRQEGSFADVA
jgi:lipopolysaccharide transport system permease protein